MQTAGWLTLDDALALGVTEITEVSEAGSVPQLRLLNRGDLPVFLLDGEELVGAKQNRILNLSVLVPERTNLEIPVSCVEEGRWSWRAGGFSSADRVIYAKLRRSNAEAVSGSLASTGDRGGDQGRVRYGVYTRYQSQPPFGSWTGRGYSVAKWEDGWHRPSCRRSDRTSRSLGSWTTTDREHQLGSRSGKRARAG